MDHAQVGICEAWIYAALSSASKVPLNLECKASTAAAFKEKLNHTIEHHPHPTLPLRLLRHTHVAGLLPQLTHGALLRAFARVDEAGGHFDADLGNWRPELFLQEEFGTGGLLEDGDDADAIDG